MSKKERKVDVYVPETMTLFLIANSSFTVREEGDLCHSLTSGI